MKFKQQQKIKRNKGSILIGVILLFIMIVSISAAVVSRSFHGSILATDSKKGYSAYQASDTAVEEILNKIKSLDSENNGPIPENTDYHSYCGDNCYAQNGLTALEVGKKVSDIYFIEKKGDAQSATRAVNVSMLDRVENPVSDLKVASDSRNKCDAKFSLTYDGATADTWKKISNLELRKSSTGGNSLENDKWIRLVANSSDIANSTPSATIKNSEFDYNTTYYFSLKAKNKNPLNLDSLYYPTPNLVKFVVPGLDCSGGQRLSCLLGPVAGSSVLKTPYTCCGAGGAKLDCYECNSGWSRDTGTCCTEKCPISPPLCSCSECGSATYSCVENKCNSKTEKCDRSGCYSKTCSPDGHGGMSCSC